jgi:hypothetical protein
VRRLARWIGTHPPVLWFVGVCVLLVYAMSTTNFRGYPSVTGWIAFAVAGVWTLVWFSREL